MERELVLREVLGRAWRAKADAQGEKQLGEQAKEEVHTERRRLPEITDGLTKEVHNEGSELANLLQTRAHLQSELSRMEEEHERERKKALDEHQRRVQELTEEVEPRAGKVGELSEFASREEDKKRELNALKSELNSREREREQMLEKARRQAEEERVDMRQRMDKQVRQTKEQMLDEANSRLDPEILGTASDNERMAAELTYHARRSDQLATSTEQLKRSVSTYRNDLTGKLDTERSLAHRACLAARARDSLQAKLENEEQALAATKAKLSEARQANSSLSDGISRLAQSQEECLSRVQHLRHRLQRCQQEDEEAQSVVDEISSLLWAGMQDIDASLSAQRLPDAHAGHLRQQKRACERILSSLKGNQLKADSIPQANASGWLPKLASTSEASVQAKGALPGPLSTDVARELLLTQPKTSR